jgi:hypothetical protein
MFGVYASFFFSFHVYSCMCVSMFEYVFVCAFVWNTDHQYSWNPWHQIRIVSQLFARWPEVIHWMSLNLSFLICKAGVLEKWGTVCEVCSTWYFLFFLLVYQSRWWWWGVGRVVASSNMNDLGERREGKGDIREGVNLFKVHCAHLWHNHNETPLYY